ncbi:hypothetical protein PPSIR1_31618, partial [Plesiocystis pacifica SIR-1]
RITIGVNPPSATHANGEFVVFHSGAEIMYASDATPPGFANVPNAPPADRVSYPAFIGHMANVQDALGQPMTDASKAAVMLRMLANPDDPLDDVAPASRTTMRELMVTWFVAEGARHRSILFSSALTLQSIARGDESFAGALADNGSHPMTGGGTASAGRTAAQNEREVLRGKGGVLNKVTTRQKAQLDARVATGENLSGPLDQLLQTYAGAVFPSRTVPAL